MKRFAPHRGLIVAVAGFLLPLGVAALLVPFRVTFADAAASLVLVAVVTLVATVGNRFAGYVAAFSAALWFDFFLTRPYDQLVITRRPDIEITVSLLVVGVIITELAVRSRRHRATALRESSYVDRISKVSELVAIGKPNDEVIEIVQAELIELLRLRQCRLVRGRDSRHTRELDREGRVPLAGFFWPVETWGLPGPEIALPILSRGQVVGRFVLTPTPGEGVSLQRRLVALAIVDQVGSLLVRHLHVA
jgi:K+-sensing histidine kinase KdpD